MPNAARQITKRKKSAVLIFIRTFRNRAIVALTSIPKSSEEPQAYYRKRDQDKDEIISDRIVQEIQQP